MTTIDRFDPFERRISDAIVEIAEERRPEYLDSILQVTARSRQRSRWAFPERWLTVNRFSYAAVGVAIAALVGGGLILARLAVTSIGGPSPSVATPSQTLGASPSPTSAPISFLPSVAQNGPIVVIVDGAAVAIASDGSRSTLPLEGLYGESCPAFSSDGRSLAYIADPSGYTNRYKRELRASDADGSNSSVLWTGLRVGLEIHEVVWSPDRQQVAAAGVSPLSGTGDGAGVAIGRLDGRPSTFSLWAAGNLSWSSDSSHLVGTRLAQDGTGVIEIHKPDGGVTTTLVTAPDVGSVAWAPDGQTIVYAASSVPGGRFALHVIGTDGKDDRVVYTSRFAPPTLLSMRWSPAGDLLAVVSYDDSEAGPSSTIELFDRTYAHVGTVGPFDGGITFFTWSPNGRSVLATSPMVGGTSLDARIAPLDGGESSVLDLPADYFTNCPIAWGAAAP